MQPDGVDCPTFLCTCEAHVFLRLQCLDRIGFMVSSSILSTLDKLLTRLPFHLDDLKQINTYYASWCRNGSQEDRMIVDLWTYCFVWRNLLVKFSRHPDTNPSDFDLIVAKGFERIVDRRHTIRDAKKYAHWVSVVCRNVFINYLRQRKPTVPFDERIDSRIAEEPIIATDDTTILIQAFEYAIGRLPDYLQDVATLRILEQQSYEEISVMTGKPVDIVRTYMNKAKKRLQNDDLLILFVRSEFLEDSEN